MFIFLFRPRQGRQIISRSFLHNADRSQENPFLIDSSNGFYLNVTDSNQRRHKSFFSTEKPSPEDHKNAIQITNMLQVNKWGEDMETALKPFVGSLTPPQITLVIQRLKEPKMALKFFQWSCQAESFRQGGASSAYHAMIELLLKENNGHGAIEILLDKMRKHGCAIRPDSAGPLIRCFGKANMVQKSVEVFHEVRKTTPMLDAFTYNCLLDVLVKAGHIDEAVKFR